MLAVTKDMTQNQKSTQGYFSFIMKMSEAALSGVTITPVKRSVIDKEIRNVLCTVFSLRLQNAVKINVPLKSVVVRAIMTKAIISGR